VGEDLQYVEKGGYGFLQAFGISREASEGEKGIPEIILRARPTAWIHEARPFALQQRAVARDRWTGPRGMLMAQRSEVLLEVLAGGRCTTIPPSLNRKTGKPYRYHNASLEDLYVDELPLITAAMFDNLEQALAPLMEPKRGSSLPRWL